MVIIKFFLFLCLIGLFAVAFYAYRFYRKIHSTIKQFNRQMGGSDRQGQRSHDDRTARQTTTQTGDTIIDNRSPREVNQKIFGKDEGEYVDYEVK